MRRKSGAKRSRNGEISPTDSYRLWWNRCRKIVCRIM